VADLILIPAIYVRAETLQKAEKRVNEERRLWSGGGYQSPLEAIGAAAVQAWRKEHDANIDRMVNP
jgi:hypothetical protein